jgi:hypothetical protein
LHKIVESAARGRESRSAQAAHIARPVFHLHIPKTAGSSVTELVKTQFRPENICPYFHQAHITGGEKWEAWQLFWGHLLLPLRDQLEDAIVFTFLRDPVERFLSEYHYVRSCREEIEAQHCITWAHGLIEPYTCLTVEQILADSPFALRRLNLQTLWLAGYQGDEEELRNTSWTDLSAAALVNLASLDFVGFLESFDDSVRALAAKCAWRFPDGSPKTKAHPARPAKGWSSELGKNLLAKLRTTAAFDYDLLHQATARRVQPAKLRNRR